MFRLKIVKNNRFGLGGALGVLLGLAMLGGVPAAFGQVSCADQADATMSADCTAANASDAATAGSLAIGEGAMVEAAPDIEVTPAVPEVPAVPAMYDLVYNGVTITGATGNLVIGTASMLMYEDADGMMQTLDYMGDDIDITSTTPATMMIPAVPAVTRPGGTNSTAVGTDAVIRGENGVAIGEGAQVINIIEAVTPADGVYNIVYNGDTFTGASGVFAEGTASTFTYMDADGMMQTLNYAAAMDDMIEVEVVTAPRAAAPEMRLVVNDGTAVGTGAQVSADNGVALGAGATATGVNGIAIGAGVTAGANAVVIGSEAATSVMVGGVDVRANRTSIATNTAAITTNTGAIGTNRAGIAGNSADIESNRAGIASAIALASLPVLSGGRGNWAIAAGTFDSKTAIAIGANLNLSESSSIKIGISSASGETGGGIGFGMRF